MEVNIGLSIAIFRMDGQLKSIVANKMVTNSLIEISPEEPDCIRV